MIPDRFNIYIKKLIENAPLFEDLGNGASTFEEGISGVNIPDNLDFQQQSNGEFFGLNDIAGIETENMGDISLASSINLHDETVDGTFNDPDISYVESITNVEDSVIDGEHEREMFNTDVVNVINHDDDLFSSDDNAIPRYDIENPNQFRKNGMLTNKSSSKKKKKTKVKLNLAVSSDMRTSRIKMVNSDAEITVVNADEVCVPEYKSVGKGKKRKIIGD